MNIPVVQVNNVRKIYGEKQGNQVQALQGVSFTIERGEFVGIMGPSGSGKTTLLHMISTLDRVSDGSITIDGVDVTKMGKEKLSDFRAQRLGFIFQDFNLLENMTVSENIALPLYLQGMDSRESYEKVKQVAHVLGIEQILMQYPAEISGGQKQRAAAARALVHNPTLILGDEPTGSLDTKNAKSLLETMKKMNEELGSTIMMVTHDAYSASYCKRIMFIQDGLLYKEIVRSTDREAFFQQILGVLAEMGPRS
jgi:putative ABC transport system ATP-binding protein